MCGPREGRNQFLQRFQVRRNEMISFPEFRSASGRFFEIDLESLPVFCTAIAIESALKKAAPMSRRYAVTEREAIIFDPKPFKFSIGQTIVAVPRQRRRQGALQKRGAFDFLPCKLTE